MNGYGARLQGKARGWRPLLAVMAALLGCAGGCSGTLPAVDLEVPDHFTELPGWAGQRFGFEGGERRQQVVLRRLEAVGPTVKLSGDKKAPWAAITVSQLVGRGNPSLSDWAGIIRRNAPAGGGTVTPEGGESVRFSATRRATIAGAPALRWTAAGQYRGVKTEAQGAVFSKGGRSYFVSLSWYPGRGPQQSGYSLDARSIAEGAFERVLETLEVPVD